MLLQQKALPEQILSAHEAQANREQQARWQLLLLSASPLRDRKALPARPHLCGRRSGYFRPRVVFGSSRWLAGSFWSLRLLGGWFRRDSLWSRRSGGKRQPLFRQRNTGIVLQMLRFGLCSRKEKIGGRFLRCLRLTRFALSGFRFDGLRLSNLRFERLCINRPCFNSRRLDWLCFL